MGRGKHCSDENKSTIKNLRENGFSMGQIAKYIGCSKTMVANALKPKPLVERRGRPKVTTPLIERRIEREAKTDPKIGSNGIKQKLRIDISSRTIRRRLTDCNLLGRVARKVPLLSATNIKKRIEFANHHLDGNDKNWKNILWSDETKINMFGSDGRLYVRRPKNQTFHSKYTNH